MRNFDLLDSLMAEIGEYSIYTKKEQLELFNKFHSGDIDARDKLINSNMRLVFYVAKKYQNYGLSIEDLIQEGAIGLQYAVERFKIGAGAFSSYAIIWIKKTIIAALNFERKFEAQEISENAVFNANLLENCIEEDMRNIIKKELNNLPSRELIITEQYYSLSNCEQKTLAECGELFKLTKQRISQINKKTLKRLSQNKNLININQ